LGVEAAAGRYACRRLASSSSDAGVLEPLRQELVRGAAAAVAMLSRARRRIPAYIAPTAADAVRAHGELSVGRALAGSVTGVPLVNGNGQTRGRREPRKSRHSCTSAYCCSGLPTGHAARTAAQIKTGSRFCVVS